MNPDGTNIARLTNNAAHDDEAVWSPDGNRIAYHGEGDDIWVMNADGSTATRLGNSGADQHPQWSPGGTRIAWLGTLAVVPGTGDILIMDADGGSKQHMNQVSASDFGWSADGAKVAYTTGGGLLVVVNADGSDSTLIFSETNASIWDPRFSPDRTRVAFGLSSSSNGNQFDVYLVNADGTNLKRLTTDPAWDTNPVWSPDGTKLVFASQRDGNQLVWMMNADGTNQVRISSRPGGDIPSSWR